MVNFLFILLLVDTIFVYISVVRCNVSVLYTLCSNEMWLIRVAIISNISHIFCGENIGNSLL